ncbi:hypothetical protein [Streptomyces sp. MNP-20]|uniref:hypothetical protein n=1 Tax=Streptomyces sp. MNP-20 TaxID=2721165 RepID=UPI001557BC73|nr:hypothetical protein [Streptomyces sp. MNP-20]
MSDREELGGVTIGAREIYDAVVATRDDVRSLTQTHESVTQTLSDHEDRLRTVERWKYTLPLAVVTSAGTAIVAGLKATGVV